jgi:hypothetical protein
MRPRFYAGTLYLFFFVMAAPCLAQDAGKIVDQYVKAAGGTKALSRIQTIRLEGAISGTEGGKPGTFTLEMKLPNRYYSEIIFGDKHLIEAYNGKSAWREDTSGSISTMLGPDASRMEAAAQIGNSHLVNLKKNKLAVSFIGHAQVRGNDALQIEVATATGVKDEVFFDPQSHRIVKETIPLGAVNEDVFYSDYRAENGVQLPHKIEIHRGDDAFSVDVTRAAVNAPAGERVFDLPLSSQVKLPDLKALFKEIDENQKALDKIKENYAGTRTEDETEYDGSGKVKKHELNEYTFFYLDGEEISTQVKKDGKPLSESEEKKETEEAQKRVEAIQNQQAKRDAKAEKAKEEGKDEKSGDDPGIEIFLRTSQFVNPRRERFRGQDVLVFDFEGNPEYKPKNLAERIVQKLAGVVWIDEKAHDVARLEAYFAGDAKIAGGLLVTIQKGTSFVYEQAFLNNEVWLPTYMEAQGGVRVLLVKGFHASEVVHYSDYKRYHVEVQSAVGAPKTP